MIGTLGVVVGPKGRWLQKVSRQTSVKSMDTEVMIRMLS